MRGSETRKNRPVGAPALREQDLLEKFIRAGGKGGQNVNKTSTCVYLKHIPTGLEVKCQRERSQAMNRLTAIRLLTEKVNEATRAERDRRRAAAEKERRRKRPRPARLRESILDAKHRIGEKKRMRTKKAEE